MVANKLLFSPPTFEFQLIAAEEDFIAEIVETG